MISNRDMSIITHLRQDGRRSMVDIAKATGIPVSTIFEKLRKNDGKLIKKFTAILDFPKLGYNIRKKIFMRALQPESVVAFCSKHKNVNSLFRVDNGYNVLIDCIFQEMLEWYEFKSALDNFSAQEMKVLDVTEEVKREDFLAVKERG